MEISFDKEYLRQLYEEGKTTDKKHRFQPHIIARYQLRVKALEQAGSIEETLSHQVAAETVVTICNILELSNHYK